MALRIFQLRYEVFTENLTILREIKRFPGSVLRAFTPPFQRLEEPKTLATASERKKCQHHVAREQSGQTGLPWKPS